MELVTNFVKDFLSNPIVWGIILYLGLIAANFIALKTKTKKDDEVMAMVNGVIGGITKNEYVASLAKKWYQEIEKKNKALKKGEKLSPVEKCKGALAGFIDEYREDQGEVAPKDSIELAKVIFGELAEEAKKPLS